MKRLAILGSTGCVGRKTLEVVRHFSKDFTVTALACNTNTSLLKEQIREFSPKYVFVHDREKAKEFVNCASLEEIVTSDCIDMVVLAIDGIAAIEPAFIAAKAAKKIALASVGVLVTAGEAFMKLVREKEVDLFFLDNELGAIDECLLGESPRDLSKVLLTASGGPFFESCSKPTLEAATVHPKHTCGKKVAVNCSTLMNKGLEVIAAKHAFAFEYEQIDVVVHPQCVVQSIVTFKDGASKALLTAPTLFHPIAYALFEKQRKFQVRDNLNFQEQQNLSFFPKDLKRFRCLKLAFAALKMGGTAPAYLNSANEVLVEGFCQGRVSWSGIGENLEELIDKKSFSKEFSLEAVLEADKEGRRDAKEISKRLRV